MRRLATADRSPRAERAPPSELVARFHGDLAALVQNAGRPLGVAVSGGPDSLALVLLAAAAFPGVVAAATVDHGLRAEAAAEARFVAEVCAGLGVPHIILAPATPIAGDVNLQARARAARYAALARWASGQGIAAVATAHHRDDQAETLLMRAARGAGLSGLAAIRATAPIAPGLLLVRPLLSWSRAELGAIVAGRGIVAVADPSNADPRFDRTRARQLLAATPWLDPARLAASAAHLAESEAALDWAARDLWQRHGIEEPDGSVALAVANLPRELQRRLLVEALRRLTGAHDPPGPKLAGLLDALRAGGQATLAGARAAGGPVWRLSRAPPRRGN